MGDATTHDGAAADLAEMGDRAAAAINRAGGVLRECERQGVPVPHLGPLDANGNVPLYWPIGTHGRLLALAGDDGLLVAGGPLMIAREAPAAGAAVRWVRERLAEEVS